MEMNKPTGIDKKVRLSKVQMSTYDAPKIVESTSEDGWVTYGPNNSYFGYINDAYNGSATNRAVINSMSQMIYGKGLDFIDSDDQIETLEAIHKLLPEKDMILMSADFKEYGQTALQVGYNSDHTEILKVQHQPIMTIAIGKMNSKGEVVKYWYSANWKDTTNYKPKAIPAFGTSKKSVELLYINNYNFSSGLMYYSNVDYQPALQYAKIEEEVANYHLNNVLNGFAPGALITFRDGKPNVQEQLDMEAKIKAKFGGSSKAGSIMLAFVEAGEEPPSIDQVSSNDLAEQYQTLSTLAQDKILVAHRVTSPLMFGIKDATGIGGSNADELIASYKLFNSLVINGFQNILINDGLQKILKFNSINVDLFFVPLMPIDFVETEDITAAVAVDNAEEIEKETGVQLKKA
jgi:hypothetical protein